MKITSNRCGWSLLALTTGRRWLVLGLLCVTVTVRGAVPEVFNLRIGGKKASVTLDRPAATDEISRPGIRVRWPGVEIAVPARTGVEPAVATTNAPVPTVTLPPGNEDRMPAGPVAAPAATETAPSAGSGTSASPQAVLAPDSVANPPPGLSAEPGQAAGPQVQPGRDPAAPGQPTDPAAAGTRSVAGAVPKVTLTDLPAIRQAFAAAGPGSGNGFTVSANGEHYAFVMRTNFGEWVVVIDGQAGPVFTAVDPLRISSHGPNDDFSSIAFMAKDAASRRVFVMQKRDGTARIFPAESTDSGQTWRVDETMCLASRRLVRTARPGAKPGLVMLQVDENGPLLGPLWGSGKLVFGPDYKHYALNAELMVPEARGEAPLGLRQPALFVDGVRVCESLLPKTTIVGRREKMNAEMDGLRVFESEPYYFVRINDRERTNFHYVVSGKVILSLAGSAAAEPVLSPDRRHIAHQQYSAPPQGTRATIPTVYLDGKVVASHPEGVSVTELKFTGDSRSLLYLTHLAGKSCVVVDGESLDTERVPIQKLVSGPWQRHYAYQAGRELVVNGRRKTVSHPQVSRLWFVPDGNHVLGLTAGTKPSVTLDGEACPADEAVQRALGSIPFDRMPLEIAPGHWRLVGSSPNFRRVDIEFPQAATAQAR